MFQKWTYILLFQNWRSFLVILYNMIHGSILQLHSVNYCVVFFHLVCLLFMQMKNFKFQIQMILYNNREDLTNILIFFPWFFVNNDTSWILDTIFSKSPIYGYFIIFSNEQTPKCFNHKRHVSIFKAFCDRICVHIANATLIYQVSKMKDKFDVQHRCKKK
jgi:hypothetical protein